MINQVRLALITLVLTTIALLGTTITQADQAGKTGEISKLADVDQAILPQYTLQSFDQISISIYNQPNLSSSQRISDIGTVALPLIGEVQIAGLTTYEAQQVITKAYIEGEYLVNPVVTIQIDSFTEQTVTILGEVSRPGQIKLPIGIRRMEIQRVIALAGDFSDIAKKSSVRIERRTSGSTKSKIFIVDVETIIEKTNNYKTAVPFYVYSGDILFVPRRFF